MPFLYARKEVFIWLKQGRKTIDIRKGMPKRGEFAVFQCGPEVLRLRIVAREFGGLVEVVRDDDFLCIIPSAGNLGDAIAYVRGLYPGYDGVFTAYHLESGVESSNVKL